MTRKIRVEKAILAVSDGRCFYCGNKATQADHIVPISGGGRDILENLVPACRLCNIKKRNYLLPPHQEVFALAHAKNLAQKISEKGWKTFGTREGWTPIRLKMASHLIEFIDMQRNLSIPKMNRYEFIYKLIRDYLDQEKEGVI